MSCSLRTGDDRRLAHLHRAGDRRAREVLIERYLPLARAFALRFRHSSEPVDDLIQVAYVGLIKAVDRWEPERGLAFSSYAVPTVLGELRHHLRDLAWAVRPPRDVQELSQSIERERAPLRAALGREPAPGDLAERLGRTSEKITEALHAGDWRTPPSLDREVADDSGPSASVGDYIGAPDAGFERVEGEVAFHQHIAHLDARAREILHLRFVEDLFQTDIARRVGFSQMHVSRIIRTSLEQL
jgi:RNA polymerase sigma-B factor